VGQADVVMACVADVLVAVAAAAGGAAAVDGDRFEGQRQLEEKDRW